jgi:hypothetical protein
VVSVESKLDELALWVDKLVYDGISISFAVRSKDADLESFGTLL